MPPKNTSNPRKRPAEEEDELEGDSPAQRIRQAAHSTAVPTRASQLASLPAKHTTSYGSPAPVMPLQGGSSYGTDLKGATRDVLANVRRENKKAKLQHEASQVEESVESSGIVTRSQARGGSRSVSADPEATQPTGRATRQSSRRPGSRQGSHKPSSRQGSRAPASIAADDDDEEEEEEEPQPKQKRPGRRGQKPKVPPAPPSAAQTAVLQDPAQVERELRRLQARREAKEKAKKEENERPEREEGETAAPLQKERHDRERARQEKKDQADKERREREEREEREEQERKEQERQEKERARLEEQARVERERAERKEAQRKAREAKEAIDRQIKEAREAKAQAERDKQAREEREKQQRLEQEREERAEHEARERAREEAEREEEERARAEQERLAREEREQEEHQRAEAARTEAARRLAQQPSPEQTPSLAVGRAEWERQRAAANRKKQEEELARRQAASGPVPAGFKKPRGPVGDEWMENFFGNPRPLNPDETPVAARNGAPPGNAAQGTSVAPSLKSFIEESRVYGVADVLTPAPSSVIDTPSRAPVSSSAISRPTPQRPVDETADRWRTGEPEPRPPPKFALQPGPRREPEARQPEARQPQVRQPEVLQPRNPFQSAPVLAPEAPQQPRRPVLAPAIEEDVEEEAADGPGAGPRRSIRQGGRKPDPPGRKEPPAQKPPANKPPANKPPAEEEPSDNGRRRRGDDDEPSDSEPDSPRGGKDGPDRPGKSAPIRRGDKAARPVRDGTPPGDDPPPDDNSSLADQFRRAWKDWRQYFWQALRWLGYFLGGLIALNLVFHLWHAMGSSNWENSGNYGLEWYGWNHMGRNLGQFIPYDLRHPLGFLDDAEYTGLRNHIYSQDGKIVKLTGQTDDVRRATEQLQAILPKVVSLKQDKKTSKLVLQQDFWHALKDLMHAEKSILTLERGKDGMNNISEDHWIAVLKRLKAQGALTTKDEIQGAVSKSWEDWVKNNRGKVDKVLGSSPGTPLSPDAEKQITNLIREKVSGKGLRDIVVTRDEFIKEVQQSIATHKREADAELAQVQDSLREMIEAAQKAASESGGMTREEVVTLTNDIVRKAISNARLGAAAKGSIANNFELDLSRRVNYFSLGNGATVDNSLTSPSYKPPHEKTFQGGKLWFGSKEWIEAKRSAPRFVDEKAAALTSWEEAGHCWCAGNRFDPADERHHPADIVIRLAHTIHPENVVMEHIDPSATLDPGAMPRDIEVWGLVEEYTQHSRARDFMMASWPDTPKDHPLLQKGFLKLGEFAYEHDRSTRGVVVYRVSEELRTLGVATDTVLVRAKSNHGADHTCFYRVRLYGSPVEEEGRQ